MSDKFQDSMDRTRNIVAAINSVTTDSQAYPALCVELLNTLEVLKDAAGHEFAAGLRELAKTCDKPLIALVLQAVATNITVALR